MTKIYLRSEVAAIVGITKRQVLFWTERGLITPAVEPIGSGTRRGYDYSNLLEFSLGKMMLAGGIGFRAAKKIMNDLHKKKEMTNKIELVPGLFLVFNPELIKRDIDRKIEQIYG